MMIQFVHFQERVRILEADIKVQKDVLNEKNAEIQKHKKTKDKCLAEIKKLTNQVTDIQAELKNVEKESESIQERVRFQISFPLLLKFFLSSNCS